MNWIQRLKRENRAHIKIGVLCFAHFFLVYTSELSFDVTSFDQGDLTAVTRVGQSPHEVLQFLVDTLGFNRILSHDFYKVTYPLNNRGILALPSLLIITPRGCSSGFYTFFNVSTNMMCSCKNIMNYVALDDPDYLQDMDIDIARIAGINVPQTVSLFKDARVEQYRAGFLYDGWYRWRALSFGIKVPFYAVARNYNMPEEDVQAIQSADIGEHSDDQKVEQSAYYKMVLDTRLGIGDMQFTLGAHALETDRVDLVGGLKVTAPSSLVFKSGFIGSNFRKIAHPCSLDLYTLGQQILDKSPQVATTMQDFGLCAINQMGAMMLATDLGTERRTKVGLFVEPTIYVNDSITWVSALRVQWLLGKSVDRYIKNVVNNASLTDSAVMGGCSVADPTDCYKGFATLENRLQEVMFPGKYCIKVCPRRETHIMSYLAFNFTDEWTALLGYDYWKLAQEHWACKPKNAKKLRVDLAQAPAATQHSLLLQACYARYGYCRDFYFKFGGDIPISSDGIGNSYTIFVKLDWSF